MQCGRVMSIWGEKHEIFENLTSLFRRLLLVARGEARLRYNLSPIKAHQNVWQGMPENC